MKRNAILKEKDWNAAIYHLSFPHILQTYQWGELKSLYTWKAYRFIWRQDGAIQAAAQVLERTHSFTGLPFKFRVLYVPKGPLLVDWENQRLRINILKELQNFAYERGAIFIKIDPDVPEKKVRLGREEEVSQSNTGKNFVNDLKVLGWIYSKEQIQFRNTMILDLELTEKELLDQMKQKTRYNIRLSQRKGLSVRIGDHSDIDILYRMYAETARRDQFIIREKEYYEAAWGSFMKLDEVIPEIGKMSEKIKNQSIEEGAMITPVAEPLIAEVDSEVIAAVIYYRFAEKAWYFYGMSRDIYREKMPNYLLQWEAIRRLKAEGCKTLDFWGAPDVFDESDKLYGIYRFKVGFGGYYSRFIGAWDFPVQPLQYKFYMRILPKILTLMRIRARGRIDREINII
jgi:peptidoglycan pentaglycine glycine transferase (the first glycine)